MHTDNPHLIKDRRHHFRTHTCCFIGKETVDWLVETKQAPDRETAVLLMKILLDNDIIHQSEYCPHYLPVLYVTGTDGTAIAIYISMFYH